MSAFEVYATRFTNREQQANDKAVVFIKGYRFSPRSMLPDTYHPISELLSTKPKDSSETNNQMSFDRFGDTPEDVKLLASNTNGI